MAESQPDFCCDRCGSDASPQSAWCTQCGSLFNPGVTCATHPNAGAEGVCVLCGKACCRRCGSWVSNVFLCDDHYGCEIREGMAKVYSSPDTLQVKATAALLEQAGYHPFLTSRRFNPGGGLLSAYPGGVLGSQFGGGMSIFLPFTEYTGAKALIADPEFLPPGEKDPGECNDGKMSSGE